VEPQVAAARRSGTDRLEQGGERFFAAIAGAYDELAAREPERIRVIDGSRPAGEVLAAALRIVQQTLHTG